MDQQRIDGGLFAKVELNLESRDELVPLVLLLMGLQALHADTLACTTVLDLVAASVHAERSAQCGRPGLDHWSLVVLAATRLGLAADFDRLQDLAENHRLIRAAMGIVDWQTNIRLDAERTRTNLQLLTPEALSAINDAIVSAGHRLVQAKELELRADTWVLQTNVHWPQDVVQVGDGLHGPGTHRCRSHQSQSQCRPHATTTGRLNPYASHTTLGVPSTDHKKNAP